ncbi:hypothetical protein [Streptomyces sp. NPDC048269]
MIDTSKVPSCSIDYSEGLEELLKSRSASPGATPPTRPPAAPAP